SYLFLHLPPAAPNPPLFPYTTLFRSSARSPGKRSFSSPWLSRRSFVRRRKNEGLLSSRHHAGRRHIRVALAGLLPLSAAGGRLKDRKSTRLNSSHQIISYAVFCLKKK